MPPMHMFLNPLGFGMELIYTSLILILCSLIYLKTKNIYELTGYKGIKYFRNAFLFFGLAYLSRFLLHLLMISKFTLDIFIPFRGLQVHVLVVVSYLSTMAIFYLVYSTVWKKFKFKHFFFSSSLIATVLSITAFLTRSHLMLIILQFVLLIFAVTLTFKLTKSSKTKVLYILILVFWLFNLYIVGPRRMFSFQIKIISQIISLVVFTTIYYKVSKWIK